MVVRHQLFVIILLLAFAAAGGSQQFSGKWKIFRCPVIKQGKTVKNKSASLCISCLGNKNATTSNCKPRRCARKKNCEKLWCRNKDGQICIYRRENTMPEKGTTRPSTTNTGNNKKKNMTHLDKNGENTSKWSTSSKKPANTSNKETNRKPPLTPTATASTSKRPSVTSMQSAVASTLKQAPANSNSTKLVSQVTKKQNKTNVIGETTTTTMQAAASTNSSNHSLDTTTVDMNVSTSSTANRSAVWNITSTLNTSTTVSGYHNASNYSEPNPARVIIEDKPQTLLAAYIGGGVGVLAVCAVVTISVVVYRRKVNAHIENQGRRTHLQHSNPAYDRTSEVIEESTEATDVGDYTYVTTNRETVNSLNEDYTYVAARGEAIKPASKDNSDSRVYSDISDLVYSVAEPFDDEVNNDEEVVFEDNELYNT